MTRFDSPVFHQASERLPAAVIRAALGVAAVAATAALWIAVGAQAGHFGQEEETAQRVTLEPVVIAGRRLPPENLTAALGAGPVAVDCAKDAFPFDAGSKNRVNLSQ